LFVLYLIHLYSVEGAYAAVHAQNSSLGSRTTAIT